MSHLLLTKINIDGRNFGEPFTSIHITILCRTKHQNRIPRDCYHVNNQYNCDI